MLKRSRSATLAAVLAGLLSAPAAFQAEPSPRRAGEVQRVEQKIAKLAERLASSGVGTDEGGWRDRQLVLASAQLEIAGKLLAGGNVRGADVIAGQAERILARVEKKEAGQ